MKKSISKNFQIVAKEKATAIDFLLEELITEAKLLSQFSKIKNAVKESNSTYIGKSDFDLPWTKAEAKVYRKDDQEVIKNNKPKLFIEEHIMRQDGTEGWALTFKAPLDDEEGNVIGVLGVFQDITDRKEDEEKIREYAKQQEILLRACTKINWIILRRKRTTNQGTKVFT